MENANKNNRIILLLGIVVVLSFLVANMLNLLEMIPFTTSILLTFFIITILLLYSSDALKYKNDVVLFWGAFVVKLLYLTISIAGQDIMNPNLDADALGFWTVANQYYNGDFSIQYTIMPFIINAEFHVFGRNYACCLLTNIMFTSIMLIYVFRIMNMLSIQGNSRLIIGAIASYMPYIIIISNSLLREPMYIMFAAISFYFFIRHIYDNKTAYLYFAIILLLPIMLGHIGYFPIALCYFVCSMKHNKIRTLKQLAIFILQLISLFALVFISMNFESVHYFVNDSSSTVDSLFQKLSGNYVDNSTLNAGSMYLMNLHANSWQQVFLFAPIRMFYYFFSPLISNWRGLADIMAFMSDSCVHFILIAQTIMQLWKARNYRDEKCKIIIICGLMCILSTGLVFAMGTATAGTAIRHRDALIAIELIMYSFAFYLRKRGKE